MTVLSAYFGWLLALLSAVLFVVLSWHVLRGLSRQFAWRISLQFLIAGAVLVTHIVSWHAAEELFEEFGIQRIFWRGMTWRESAELALMNLTMFSVLAFVAVMLYRLISWALERGVSEQRLLSGRLGRAVNATVTILTVISSLLTILQAARR